MRLRRRLANALLKEMGLRKLHETRLTHFVRSALDEIDLQNFRDTHPCVSFGDRAEMYDHVHRAHVAADPIDYLEFGVFQGDSIRRWAMLNRHKDSRFFGFDSFEGLPEDWRAGQGKGHFSVDGTVPHIDDPRVTFVKGWFEDTVPSFAREFSARNRLLLHLDGDLYGSAMLPLIYFSPFMSKGSLIIFDEFYDREHEFRALLDWQRIYKKPFRVVAEMQNYSKICAELA